MTLERIKLVNQVYCMDCFSLQGRIKQIPSVSI